MDMVNIQLFLKWCTIINGLLLLASILVSMLWPSGALAVHSTLFQVPKESLSGIIYALVGIYKILWLVFNLVPYLALAIIAKSQ